MFHLLLPIKNIIRDVTSTVNCFNYEQYKVKIKDSNIIFHYLFLYFYHHTWLLRLNSALSVNGKSIPEEVSDMLPKTADLSSSSAKEPKTSH